MRQSIIGDLMPYRAYYRNAKDGETAWKAGCEFVLESDSHCLNGLLVSANIFDKTDGFRLFLQGRKGKFIIVSGNSICKL